MLIKVGTDWEFCFVFNTCIKSLSIPDDVGEGPAPGPWIMTVPSSFSWISIAFIAPEIFAKGLFKSIIVGCTLANIPDSIFSAIASNLIEYPNSLAYWKSIESIFEIPSTCSFGYSTSVLNANEDNIDSLYLASNPSISFVGSGSAYPSFWDNSSASINSVFFSSISERIKLLVPFMIALIELIFE